MWTHHFFFFDLLSRFVSRSDDILALSSYMDMSLFLVFACLL